MVHSIPRQLLNSRAQRQRQQRGVVTLPAPVGGLNTIAAKSAMPIQDAISMVNWYPDTGEVKARNGSAQLATSVGSGDVSTLAEYNSGTIRKLLAASEDTIFDVANELDYTADAVDFDGTNDYLSKDAALSGASDGKQLTGSIWAKFDAAKDSDETHLVNIGREEGFRVVRQSNNSTNSVEFDGTNDYLLLSSEFTGISDGKQGTISAWVKFDAAQDGNEQRLFVMGDAPTDFAIQLHRQPSGGSQAISISAFNTGGTKILDIDTTAAINSADGWVNVLASWDLSDTNKRHLYINDSSDLSVVTYTDDNIDYDLSGRGAGNDNVSVGANIDGADKLDGKMSDLWFNTSYIDLSVEANRRKFITSGGEPVNLGSDGSAPTGTQPVLFLSGDSTDFVTNKGSGGGFTENGALADSSDSPSSSLNVSNIKISGFNTSTSLRIEFETTAVIDSNDGWVNILFSFDTSDTSKAHLYINDTSDINVIAHVDGNISFTNVGSGDDNSVGAADDGTHKFDGLMSDVWLDTTYIDLSITANRRKFITDNGRPVGLGSDGSTPTGSQPLVFLTGDEAAYPSNEGSGGGFTENGAIADTSDTPSQQTKTLKTGLTYGLWQTANFNAQQLWVNGRDTPQVFNGQTFSNSTISGPTDVTKLVGVNIFKNRVYVWEEDTQDFWYGATNAIGGVFTKFPLSRVGRKGGKLVFMATWTIDGGEGQDDHAVFVMSTGETLIYKGSSPADTNWSLIGVFEIGEPLGIRAWAKVGGDILIATREDHVFLGDVLRNRVKRSKISGKARDDAKLYATNTGWEVVNYPQGGMLLVNVPVSSTNFDQHVLNTVTGAWTTFDGMNARTWATFKGDLVFGGGSGVVFKADTGADDNGTPISLSAESAWFNLQIPFNKLLASFEPIFDSASSFSYTAGFASDFGTFPTLPTLTYTPSGVNEQGAEGYGRVFGLKVTADLSQAASWHGTVINYQVALR